ncbi:MAG: branched-chain amino acid aminotransferase [Rhodobacteraceae bacterium]|nr:branched-chain amino acid aminotransferase [Paracoccaceae bacterium]
MAIGKKILTFWDGAWHEGNLPVIRAADHVAWLGTQVFDGARMFDGVMPDLDLHCARLIRSATALGMETDLTGPEIEAIVRDGVKRYPAGAELYIRPMMWACDGSPGIIDLDPTSTTFSVCIEDLPMPAPGDFSLTVAPYCRPRQDMALTEAKAGSLYPNNGRIMAFARKRGFSNALSLDVDGYVAETASTNVFVVRDGVVFTPVPNGCFLNGLTRQRVIALLRADGVQVIETQMRVEDFEQADEVFCTGNIAKVMPVSRFQERVLGIGPVSARARVLYFDFARSGHQQAA